MKNKIRIELPFHLNLVIVLLGLVLFFLILVIASSLLVPIAFAFVFAVFLSPICVRLERWRFPRWLAILTTMLAVIFVISVIFSIIFGNMLTFSKDVPKMQERFLVLLNLTQKTLEQELDMSSEKQLDWLNSNLKGFINLGGVWLNNFINSATSFMADLLLVFIYTFFMIYYRDLFKNFIHKLLDDQYHEKATHIEVQIQKVTQRYVSGLITVIFIVAALNIVGLLIIDIPHAIFFGALAALLTIIPYIGVFIGSLLPILYALVMKDSMYYPLAVFIWFQVVQFLEGNFITPNIVGSQLSINPLAAIIALLIGSMVWGIAGMILFVPLMAMLKVVMDNIPQLAPYGYLISEGEDTAVLQKIAKEGETPTNRWYYVFLFWRKK